jgi:hypothetical protein
LRIAVFFGCLALAFAADRPQLNGTWQSANAADIIAIQQSDDSIQITETVHDKQTTDVRCNTSGKSCKVKGGEITFWYSGPMLVMMESLHSATRVTEKRWTSSADGKTLNLEVLRINPAGTPEKLTYIRKGSS